MVNLFPDVVAKCFRFHCDELLMETTLEQWQDDLAKIEKALDKIPALANCFRLGAFTLNCLTLPRSAEEKAKHWYKILLVDAEKQELSPETFVRKNTWDPLVALLKEQNQYPLQDKQTFFVIICPSQFRTNYFL